MFTISSDSSVNPRVDRRGGATTGSSKIKDHTGSDYSSEQPAGTAYLASIDPIVLRKPMMKSAESFESQHSGLLFGLSPGPIPAPSSGHPQALLPPSASGILWKSRDYV